MRRARYSYWKKRRSPRRRSAPWDPPSTSKGANWTTDGSRRDWSTTTVAASVSSTAQVRTMENCSPIRMAPVLVRHQHCSGSADRVGCADTRDAPISIITKRNPVRRILDTLSCLCCLPQSPFRNEFAQRNRGLLFVDPDAQDVEAGVLGHPRNLVLPAPGLGGHRAELAARHDARPSG